MRPHRELWPAQSPAAKLVFDDDERHGSAFDSVVSAGCIVSGGTVRRCLLFNDVRVNSYRLVEGSILLPGVTVGRRARGCAR